MHFLRGTNVPSSSQPLAKALRTKLSSLLGHESKMQYCGRCQTELPPKARYCDHCLSPETIVSGDYMHILNYETGDTCLGVTGKNSVTQTFRHNYDGKLFMVKARGMLPIMATPNHPIMVVSRVRRGVANRRGKSEHFVSEQQRSSIWRLSDPHWKNISDLTRCGAWMSGDYVLMPRVSGWIDANQIDLSPYTTKKGAAVARGRNFPTTFSLSHDSAWLLGIYVAEGSANPKGGGCAFSLGRTEIVLKDKIVRIAESIGYLARVREMPTASRVILPSRLLARALPAWCGQDCYTKRIPEFILYHKNIDLLYAFLKGYWSGDGCETHNRRSGRIIYKAVTVSRILALQLQFLSARIGQFLSVCENKRQPVGTIQGRKFHQSTAYMLAYAPPRNHENKQHYMVRADEVLLPVDKVEEVAYEGPVFNLATVDKTYLANNIVVHNCGAEIHRR